MEFLETAFAQYAFAWKLLAYAEDGRFKLDELDHPMTWEEGRMTFVLPDKIFESYDDLVLACQNGTSVAFGAAAIALNRAREESGFDLPDPIVSERDHFISLVYQVRNAFSHDIAQPRWNIRPRYRMAYRFGGINVDLSGVEDGQPFSYEDIGGPDRLIAMKDFFVDNMLQ